MENGSKAKVSASFADMRLLHAICAANGTAFFEKTFRVQAPGGFFKNRVPLLHYKIRLSEQERRVDALALRADERRDKLR